MVLNFAVMPVIFNLGLDTKNDPKSLLGGLLTLENVFLLRSGEFSLRHGYDQLSSDTLDGYSVTEALGLATFNQELVLLNNGALYSWAPQISQWADKGTVIFTDINTTAAVTNSYQQLLADVAISESGIEVLAWEDSRGGVRATVKDLSSGAILIGDTELNPDGVRPRCFSVGQYLFVYYYDTTATDLVVRRVDVLAPSAFSDEVIVASDINTSTPIFDVCLVGTSRMVVGYRNTSNELKLAYFLQNNTVGGVLQGVPDPTAFAAEDPDMCITLFIGQEISNQLTFDVAWSNSSAGVKHMAFYSNFIEYKSSIVIDSYGTDARNITGITFDTEADLFWEIPDAYVTNYLVDYSSIDITANTASAAETIQRAGGLASKAYRHDAITSVIVSYESIDKIQNTYFAINSTGLIEGKILPQAGAGHTTSVSSVPGVWQVDNEFYFLSGRKTRLVVGTATEQALIGINQTSINYSSAAIGVSSQLGQNLYIPGGYLKAYDGQSVIEQNYHLYPETPTAALSVTDGYLGDGTYEYILIWEWIDAQGQIFQSETSVPLSFAVTGGPKAVDLTIATLRYTDKKAPDRTPVVISVYRTEASGTTFYKVSSDTALTYNDTLADTVTFTDTLTDADIVSRPLLYTTGGILDNAPCPAADVIISAKNRLFAGGLENRNEIAFSKEYVNNEAINFVDVFRQQIPAKGGDITALAEMDEKVVIFKESGILYLTGDGPDDTGSGTFTITPVATDVGTIEPESIVLMPDGLMFKSSKGIWLLSRGLASSYIGDKVQEFNDLSISSAAVVADLNQVRFTTLEGTTLVYDYYHKLWGTFTNQEAIAALNWQGNYVFVKSDGLVWQENRAVYADNNVPIVPKIGTQWFSWGAIQGFQRVRRALILGEYKGSHNLKVSVFYNFKDSPDETYVYNMTDNGYSTTYGSDSPYGEPEDSVFGTLEGIYQFQINFKQQKCESVRLQIEAVYPESTGTEGFTLSSLSFEVGVKGGVNRMPNSKTINGT